MEHFTGGWEDEYSRRGLLWGGATQDLPPVPAGSRVLEIGCGNGKTLSSMVQREWDVTSYRFLPAGSSNEQGTLCGCIVFRIHGSRHHAFTV